MKFKYLLLVVCLLGYFTGRGQAISGQIVDRNDTSPMIGVATFLINQTDTTKKVGTATDEEGRFRFDNLASGNYTLRASYLGYRTLELAIVLKDSSSADLGMIAMEESAFETKTIVIEGRQVRSTQKGDTTEFRANAFKTHPDATAQDLVTKMPGVTVENGTVKAQGETVQKVLIDGKEFFGEDATIALKNLPAEIVDRVQVFDRLSDQSQFTGFDDGNTQKTINIVTKPGRNAGSFGKIYGGYGSDQRYASGLVLNNFKGTRRLSLLGMSNNVNQQNFSNQDLLGVSSGGGNNRAGGMGGFGGGRGRGGATDNFLVGSQRGITTTNSIGLNYSDTWAKKINIAASYFFNNAYNSTESLTKRNYFLSRGNTQFYNENSDASSDNYNHRLNARLEYKIDSSNTLLFTPRISFQHNSSTSSLQGINTLSDTIPLSQLSNSSYNSSSGFNLAGDLIYRHKFSKKGRTIALGAGTTLNDRSGTRNQYSYNRFYLPSDSASIVNQRTQSASDGWTVSPSINYTEPIGKIGILMVNYNPSFNRNNADRQTFGFDSNSNEYSILNNVLSNTFRNVVTTQKGGMGYRIGNKKWNVMTGMNYQMTKLQGNQTFPVQFQVDRDFKNLLPYLRMDYKFTPSKNLRVAYRASTQVPSVTQLQNVIDNSNPLQLSTGNPNLKQEYTHFAMARYGATNASAGTTFNAFLNFSLTNDYIGSSTLIATENIALTDQIQLNRGSQLSQPVNLEGYANVNSFLTYGMPIDFIKSNVNFNGGYLYNTTPSLINGARNEAKTHTLNGGVTIGSNISPRIDFNLSYSANYNIVKNTIRPTLNSNYFYHITSFRINLLPWKGLLLGSDITNTLYEGLSAFNQNFFLWNPYIGYKFLKDNAAEIRISAFDLLDQNNSISRTVTGSYIEDNQTLVLRRYFMVTLTYNIRKFQKQD